MRTNQEIYDIVLFGLRKQGQPSVSENGDECAYRGIGGTKCGIGFLIPDERYDEELEGLGVWEESVAIAADLTVEQDLLARALQSAHDKRLAGLADSSGKFLGEGIVAGFPAWEQEMARIAQEFGLTYTEPAL